MGRAIDFSGNRKSQQEDLVSLERSHPQVEFDFPLLFFLLFRL